MPRDSEAQTEAGNCLKSRGCSRGCYAWQGPLDSETEKDFRSIGALTAMRRVGWRRALGAPQQWGGCDLLLMPEDEGLNPSGGQGKRGGANLRECE